MHVLSSTPAFTPMEYKPRETSQGRGWIWEIQLAKVRQHKIFHGKAADSTIQYSTVQYSTVQYNTVQYCTVQYRADMTGFRRFQKRRLARHSKSLSQVLLQHGLEIPVASLQKRVLFFFFFSCFFSGLYLEDWGILNSWLSWVSFVGCFLLWGEVLAAFCSLAINAMPALSTAVWSCLCYPQLDLWIVPAWTLKNEEVFRVGLVDRPRMEP